MSFRPIHDIRCSFSGGMFVIYLNTLKPTYPFQLDACGNFSSQARMSDTLVPPGPVC
jgi:hypothetical protein